MSLTASSQAGVLGVLGFSGDGSSVYFAAIGALAPNANAFGEHAENRSGGLKEFAGNVYEWHAGAPSLTFVAQVADYENSEQGGDEEDWTEVPVEFGRQKVARVTGDGSRLLFANERQLFLYTAGAGGGVGSLVCVSCTPGGGGTAGEATLDGDSTGAGFVPRDMRILTRNLSENGNRVFFDTAAPLLPGDTNGQTDVYEWEAEGEGSCRSDAQDDGCLYLISTGAGNESSYFGDASANGSDVFFFTRQQLASSDEDSNVDVYDARVEAEGPSHEPCVQGTTFNPATGQCEREPCYTAEECRPPLSEPPAESFPATAAFTGPGNLTFSPPPPAKITPKVVKCKRGYVKKKVKKKERCVKVKSKKHANRASGKRRGSR